MKDPLRLAATGRDKRNAGALVFYFHRPVTDDELNYLHEVMKRAAACVPEPDSPLPFSLRIVPPTEREA